MEVEAVTSAASSVQIASEDVRTLEIACISTTGLLLQLQLQWCTMTGREFDRCLFAVCGRGYQLNYYVPTKYP